MSATAFHRSAKDPAKKSNTWAPDLKGSCDSSFPLITKVSEDLRHWLSNKLPRKHPCLTTYSVKATSVTCRKYCKSLTRFLNFLFPLSHSPSSKQDDLLLYLCPPVNTFIHCLATIYQSVNLFIYYLIHLYITNHLSCNPPPITYLSINHLFILSYLYLFVIHQFYLCI